MNEQLYACLNPLRPEVGFVLTVLPSCPCGHEDCTSVYVRLDGQTVVRRETARNRSGEWSTFEMVRVKLDGGDAYYLICNGACISEGLADLGAANMVWEQAVKAAHIAREYMDGRVSSRDMDALMDEAHRIGESLALGLLTGDEAWEAVTEAVNDLYEGK